MLIFVMLIAHTVADFIIQPRDVVKNKSSMKFIGYLNHGLGLVLTLIPLILFIKFSSIISVAYRICIIIVIHLLVDFIKERIQNHFRDYEYAKIINLILFTCDQLINIIVIILLTGRTSIEFNGLNEFFLEFIFVQGGFTYQDLKYIFIILYISFSGAYFVPLLFDIVYRGVDDYAGSLKKII